MVVNAVVLDGELVWAATDYGVAHGRPGRWKMLSTRHGLPHRQVWDLELAENGDIWAATAAGLVRISGGRVDVMSSIDSGLPGDLVLDISLQGMDVWVATSHGLGHMDLRSGGWRLWTPENAPLRACPMSRVLALEDRVWVGSFGDGLFELDPAAGTWKKPVQQGLAGQGAPQEASSGSRASSSTQAPWPGRTAALAAASTGGVWVGHARGLSRLREGHVEQVLPARAGMGTACVHALAEADGRLFVGSDRGLVVLDGERWFRYTMDGSAASLLSGTLRGQEQGEVESRPLNIGVAAHTVRGIALGEQDIWLATGQGLGRCQAGADEQEGLQAARPAAVRREPKAAVTDGPGSATAWQAHNPGRLSAMARELRLGLVMEQDPGAGPGASVSRGLIAAMDPEAEQGKRPLVGYRHAACVLGPEDHRSGLAEGPGVKLVFDRQVRALLVAPGHDRGWGMAQLAIEAEVPLLLLGEEDPWLREQAHPWGLALGPDGPAQARALMARIASMDRHRPVLLHGASTFGRMGAAWIEEAASRIGRPLAAKLAIPVEEPKRSETVQAVQGLDPDALILWGTPQEAGPLLQALRGSGVSASFLGPARLATRAFLGPGGAGPAAEGCLLALPFWHGEGRAEEQGEPRDQLLCAGLDHPDPWEAMACSLAGRLRGVLAALPSPDRAALLAALQGELPGWEGLVPPARADNVQAALGRVEQGRVRSSDLNAE